MCTVRNTLQMTWKSNSSRVVVASIFASLIFLFILVGGAVFFSIANSLHVLSQLLGQVFFGMLMLMFAGAVPFVSSTLVLSGDHVLLFSSPAPPRTVLAARLLDGSATSAAQFLVIGLPIIPAAALAAHWHIVTWPLLIPISLLFLMMPALMASLLLLVILQAAGPRRFKTSVVLLNLLMGIFVCILFIIQIHAMPIQWSELSGKGWSVASGNGLTLDRYLPSIWIAHLLSQPIRGDRWVADILKLFTLDALLFAACLVLGKRLPELAGEALSSVDTGESKRASGFASRLLPRELGGFVARDLQLVKRDSMLLSQLGVPLILAIVPFVIGLESSDIDTSQLLFPFAVGVTALILYMQTSILSLSLTGMDGQAFWQVMGAPRPMIWHLISKWAVSSAISFMVASLLLGLYVITFHATPVQMVTVWILLGFTASSLCGLGVGTAAVFPKFVHDNPGIRVSQWALIVGFLVSVGYSMCVLLLLGGGYLLEGFISSTGAGSLIWIVTAILIALLSLLCVVIPIKLGSNKLQQLEWNL